MAKKQKNFTVALITDKNMYLARLFIVTSPRKYYIYQLHYTGNFLCFQGMSLCMNWGMEKVRAKFLYRIFDSIIVNEYMQSVFKDHIVKRTIQFLT